jgi:hypothetical protein
MLDGDGTTVRLRGHQRRTVQNEESTSLDCMRHCSQGVSSPNITKQIRPTLHLVTFQMESGILRVVRTAMPKLVCHQIWSQIV